jgi:hypothetical protein
VACASQKGMMTAGTRLAQEWNLWGRRNVLYRTTCPQIPSHCGRPDSPSSRHLYPPKYNQNNCITVWMSESRSSLEGFVVWVGKELSVPGHRSVGNRDRGAGTAHPYSDSRGKSRCGAKAGCPSWIFQWTQQTAHSTQHIHTGPCTSLFFAMDELMPTLIFGAEIQPSFSALGNY